RVAVGAFVKRHSALSGSSFVVIKMTNTDSPSTLPDAGTTPSVRAGALVWMLAVQFFIAQVVVQLAWTTPFSLTATSISDLGTTPWGPYPLDSQMYVCSPWHAGMNASFILLGLIILVGAALLYQAFPPGIIRAAGLVLLALAGAGIIAVGLFPENENIGYHRIGAAAHFILGNLSMIALGVALRPAHGRRGVAVYTAGFGIRAVAG